MRRRAHDGARRGEAAAAQSVDAGSLVVDRQGEHVDAGVAHHVPVERDARRLFVLPVWRETAFFTGRERVALELTEAMTRLSEAPVTDQTIARASEHFSVVELAELIWTITVINAWNRLGATAHPWPLS